MTGPLRLTTATTLVAAGLIGASAAWGLTAVADWTGDTFPEPSSSLIGTLATLGLLLIVGSRLAHRRFHVQRRLVDPSVGRTILALAKASALAGAGLVGVYLLLVGIHVPSWDRPWARSQVIAAAAALVAALLIMIGGLVLERECRHDHDGKPPQED